MTVEGTHWLANANEIASFYQNVTHNLSHSLGSEHSEEKWNALEGREAALHDGHPYIVIGEFQTSEQCAREQVQDYGK